MASIEDLASARLHPTVTRILDRSVVGSGKIVIVTGAGVSAESGIPTFRGPEGYWRIGSRNYRPEELATHAAFQEMPDEVWAWYLYRRGVCRAAEPNPAHKALVDLESAAGDRFALITQNVDGLHLRAGNSAERTYQIHGNIDFMRCAMECSLEVRALPDEIGTSWDKARGVADGERALLRCARCGRRARPHILWFDETYDEERYRAESALEAAGAADLLIIAGTSGAASLPHHVARVALRNGTPILAVNPDPSPFTEIAAQAGAWLEGPAGRLLPLLATAIRFRLEHPT